MTIAFDAIIAELQTRYPAAVGDGQAIQSQSDYVVLQVTEAEVRAAIMSFPAGSAGELGCICLRYSQDLINNKEGLDLLELIYCIHQHARWSLRQSLSSFLFFGDSRIALERKGWYAGYSD